MFWGTHRPPARGRTSAPRFSFESSGSSRRESSGPPSTNTRTLRSLPNVSARVRGRTVEHLLRETRPATRILDSSISTDPQSDVARAVKLGRHLRSRYRCSMSSAVRMVSRTLLRSSSIPEPSDPPSRVIIFSITTIVIWSSFDYHLCQIVCLGCRTRVRARRFCGGRNALKPVRMTVPPATLSHDTTLGFFFFFGVLPPPYPSLRTSIMILPQVHLRKPCYDFYCF
jgi:hypothetical protein